MMLVKCVWSRFGVLFCWIRKSFIESLLIQPEGPPPPSSHWRANVHRTSAVYLWFGVLTHDGMRRCYHPSTFPPDIDQVKRLHSSRGMQGHKVCT